ncbi:signal transducer and activator of transcription 5B-like [Pecten maximus]|uniref:signal transducer and activator of transcription 5B-like n=1 Tax=Pecten maximus TaxID=6579 RepID=UPI001458CE4C|nr:signal transducer and activator of transcription 5B-like [Pecten maximus]
MAAMTEKMILPLDVVIESISTNSELKEKWNHLYIYKEEIKKLRLRCKEFLAEDKCWNQALNSYVEKSWQTDGNTSELLYELLIRCYQDKCDQNSADGIIISGELTTLQNKYEGKHSDLITDLLMVLHSERQLLRPSQEEGMDTSEKDGILHNVQQLDVLRKNLDELVQSYENVNEEIENHQQCIRALCQPGSLQNGLRDTTRQAEIEHYRAQLHECNSEKCNTEKGIYDTLNDIVNNADTVLKEMQMEMEHWRMEQRKYYVDVATKPSLPNKPPLTKWCAHAGLSLFDLIRCSLPNIPQNNSLNLTKNIQTINEIFDQMQLCSFVVTDQVKNYIKVSMGTKKKGGDGQDEEDEDSGGNKKFSCPKFKATVRLVAAASIDSVEQVRAYFVHEDYLSQVKDPATHDFSTSKYPLKDTKQKGASSTATSTVEKDTGNATFKSLELKSFNREKESNVAKEKFRIVFQTKMRVGERVINLWTMSLPIVVITGASQQCNACGSLLWQCLNPADKGQFPPPACPEELPWSQVKELLDTKIKYLGGRGLTQDEEKHLVSRISGDPNISLDSDPLIPFRKFCIDKMMDISDPNKKPEDRKKSATFWMWFQAVYNLINTHLKEYWKKELILGFLDKEQANECLKDCRQHTFLLRFSNNIITDAQGQNMCGAISVSYMTAARKTDHMLPSITEDLKKYNLALTLKRMINGKTHECEMKWVYPGMKPREEEYRAFLEDDCPERKRIDGYTKLKEMLVIEQVNDELGGLTLNERQKKRPVHRVKGQNNFKVAKVTAVSHVVTNHDEESSSGQQSGNLPKIVDEREPNEQSSNNVMQVIPGSATLSRTRSVPQPSDVATKPISSTSRSLSHPHTTKFPHLQNILSEPVKDGLKIKLLQGPNATHFPQGCVEVNQGIGWSQAEDRLDMVHHQKKTITGGNNGFFTVESSVKPCNSPVSLLPFPESSIKQSGSPQLPNFMDPKMESLSPAHTVQSMTQNMVAPPTEMTFQSPMLSDTSSLGSHIMLTTDTSSLGSHIIVANNPQPPVVITDPTNGPTFHPQIPTVQHEQHELYLNQNSEEVTEQPEQGDVYPDLDLGDIISQYFEPEIDPDDPDWTCLLQT